MGEGRTLEDTPIKTHPLQDQGFQHHPRLGKFWISHHKYNETLFLKVEPGPGSSPGAEREREACQGEYAREWLLQVVSVQLEGL